MNKNKIIMEVVERMNARIETGAKGTGFQDREDVKQDIHMRLVKVAHDMDVISFWTFKQNFEKNTENG
ncbi:MULTISPECIES: hypothetical protein [Salimicrobium]|uniref:Spo0E like sporulation regulatory protein n=2 Tax=Salimicrobium TaxID=351195 RepID=A0ABX4HN92_9BACI|nr:MULTISPECIES: hypothetical protein [Salimicrobium]PBB04654.1 hypothetical protein CKW00_12960 [Salimicrobium humidisoli]SDY33731.1 hypothetical protein SAMN04488081_2662 [Salimicrobium album]